MPSKSAAQARLMRAAAHTKGGFGGVPQAVGKEFASADKGKKFSKGGDMKKRSEGKARDALMQQALQQAAMQQAAQQQGGPPPGAAPQGPPPGMGAPPPGAGGPPPGAGGPPPGMKKGGAVRKMADGGKVSKEDPEIEAGEKKMKFGEHADQKKGHTKAKEPAMKKGGAVKRLSRGGGIEIKGKTRGRIC